MTDFDFDTPLSDKEWDILEDFIAAQQDHTPFATLSALDGFLTAVVSGPEMIPPMEWLAFIFGGDMEAPQWQSDEQPEVIIGLLLRLMNNIATVISETPDVFSPLFMAYRDELAAETADTAVANDDEDIVVVDEWCQGYMHGHMMRHEAWEGHEDAIEAYLQPIFIYGTEEGRTITESLNEDEENAFKAAIPQRAIDIYNYWLDIRSGDLDAEDFADLDTPQEPFLRVTPKTGRNDPCTCGSGKKNKHCCGLN